MLSSIRGRKDEFREEIACQEADCEGCRQSWREVGVQFKSLTDPIDTGTPSGHFFFHVMVSLAEMERELIVERTRAGLDIAPTRTNWRTQAPHDSQQS